MKTLVGEHMSPSKVPDTRSDRNALMLVSSNLGEIGKVDHKDIARRRILLLVLLVLRFGVISVREARCSRNVELVKVRALIMSQRQSPNHDVPRKPRGISPPKQQAVTLYAFGICISKSTAFPSGVNLTIREPSHL